MKSTPALLKLAPALFLIAGCGGSSSNTSNASAGNSSNSSATSSMLQGFASAIPGLGGAKTQQAFAAAQTGAKALDVADLESQQRQDEIGQAIAVAITDRYPLSTNVPLTDYVNLVGLTVASVAPNADINYSFGVLETPEVGAYSAPGGYIFITRGALAMLQDESELAGVLAHEVAHVALKHGIDAVKAAKTADLGSSAIRTADARVGQYSQFVDAGADAILVKGYSRSQEDQADAQAVKYLSAAGYDAQGLLRFLQRLQSVTGSGGGMRQLMSTHPGTAERVQKVQSQTASLRGGQTLKDRFSANVKL